MIRKFKHYATGEIKTMNVSNGTVEINEKIYKLEPWNKDIKIVGTSWVLIKNDKQK